MRISLILVPLPLLAACGGSEPAGPSAPPPVPVATVEVTPATASLFAGDSVQFTATAQTSAGATVAGKPVTWTTNPAGVATVSSTGLVRAVSAGQAQVTASIEGKSGVATVTVTVVGPPVSAAIGAAGGTIATPLADGSTASLVVPAGALVTSTLLELEPARPLPGTSATVLLRPSGQAFAKPTELQFLIPGGPPAGTVPALVYQSASGPGYLPLRPGTVSNRFVATLDRLEAPQPFAAEAPAAAPWAAGAADAFVASLQALSLAALKDSARAALNRFQADKSLARAERLNGVMSVLAFAQPLAGFEPDGGALLQSWRTELCTRLDQITTAFQNTPTSTWPDFPPFFSAINVVLGWVGVVQKLDEPELALPFAGCGGAYNAVLRDKAGQFVDWFIADLESRQGSNLAIRFNEMLDLHVPRTLTLQAGLAALGLDDFSGDLTQAMGRLFDALRKSAWTGCRARNETEPLARLLRAEAAAIGAESLSGYDIEDLKDDAEECGTEVFWTLRDVQGDTQGNGTLGGSAAGSVNRSLNIALPIGGSIRLTGLVRALMCPGDVRQGIPESINAEQLKVSARFLATQTVLATRPVPTNGPPNYIHNDSLVYTPAQLRAAVNLADDLSGTVIVRLERVGLNCVRGYDLLHDPATLVELNLDLQPETCEEDDLRAGSARAIPGVSPCEEPPPPPPPPPPPGGNCPAIVIGAGGLPANSDSLTKLTCIRALLVRSAEPVSIPTITAVTEALAVRFPTTSFSAPALSWVGATDISASTLTALSLPSLATVAGPLSISGTGISALGQVGCPTVFGGLVISGNLNLPQSEAVAKGNCMTVHGSKSIQGNKP